MIDFQLGADPEICIANKYNVIGESTTETLIGRNDNDDDEREFGLDGNGVTFEIRPSPSKNPFGVVNNIYKILSGSAFGKPEHFKYQWFAGSFKHGFPLGGHVHFGLPDTYSHRLHYSQYSQNLSQYLGPITVLIENCDEGKKRRGPDYGYGGICDYRQNDHGFEYRTPSSWLTSPYIALAVLCLAKTVLYERINGLNPEFFVLNSDKSPNFNEYTYYQMETETFRKQFPLIWKNIQKMTLYQEYKPYIDLLYFLVDNNISWFPKCSMREAWGIVDTRNSHRSNMKLDAIWARFKNLKKNYLENK